MRSKNAAKAPRSRRFNDAASRSWPRPLAATVASSAVRVFAVSVFAVRVFAVSVFAVSALAACLAEPAPAIDVKSARIPLALEGNCSGDPGFAFSEFTDEVKKLRAVVVAADMDGAVEAEGDVDSLVIEEIPAGENRAITLYGLNANGAATWRAFRPGITVEVGTETPVDLLMARVADLSCPRTTLDRQRGFHTATTLNDGRVLLVGGADSILECGDGCARLSGSSFAEIYDPSTGMFSRTTGALQRNRLLHTATLLDDGRVLIAGGASEAEIVDVDAQSPFPIRVIQGVRIIEIFDPERGDFTSVGEDSSERVFHAAARTEDGAVILSGGIPALPQNGINDLNNALVSTTKCDVAGANVSCSPYASMVKPRAGHVSFLNGSTVVIWGGSVDTTPAGAISGYHTEQLVGGAFSLVEVQGMRVERNVFFGNAVVYLESPLRVLMSGGLVRATDGSFSLATVPQSGGAAASVFIFDGAGGGGVGQIGSGPPNGNPMALSSPRFFAAGAGFPDGKRVVITGGFSDLGFTPSNGLDIYDETSLTVSPLSVGGQPRTMRQARGGHTATSMSDGTVVFAGGQTGTAAETAPLLTAEIFADPEPPPGAAK